MLVFFVLCALWFCYCQFVSISNITSVNLLVELLTLCTVYGSITDVLFSYLFIYCLLHMLTFWDIVDNWWQCYILSAVVKRWMTWRMNSTVYYADIFTYCKICNFCPAVRIVSVYMNMHVAGVIVCRSGFGFTMYLNPNLLIEYPLSCFRDVYCTRLHKKTGRYSTV